jgi:hypothetical protein
VSGARGTTGGSYAAMISGSARRRAEFARERADALIKPEPAI